jgi:membrane-associated phospholipid phosphatase
MNFTNWTAYWKSKKTKKEFLITSMILIVLLFLFSNFLIFVENRQGIVINDPILKFFNPVNVTWITFLLIYAGVITAIIYLSQFPQRLVLGIQVYIGMVLFRIIVMYVVPLEPPVSMIELKDPIVEYVGTGIQMNKDLFFSGHTATMFLLYLISKEKIFKSIYLILTLLVAICVLLQHVHYTIDVVSAPFFTFGSYNLVLYAKKLLGKNNSLT